jgi:large subunit ribosomal protein L28
MAFKCDNCGKHQIMGNRVSHAKNRTRHAFKPNIQKKKIMVDGISMRMKLCTSCIKTLKKAPRAKAVKAESVEAPVVPVTTA